MVLFQRLFLRFIQVLIADNSNEKKLNFKKKIFVKKKYDMQIAEEEENNLMSSALSLECNEKYYISLSPQSFKLKK